MAATRFRLGFKFWLNLENPQENELADEIENLKQKRTFARTIREGIRLICDLRRGRTEVLEELFPWVLEQKTGVEPLDYNQNDYEEGPLGEQLKRLESLLVQGLNAPKNGPQHPTKALPPPQRESLDIEPELEIKAATQNADNNANWNFLLASAMQIYGYVDDLPPEVIAYGLRTKRITPAALKQKSLPKMTPKPQKSAATVPKPPQNSGPKAMQVPDFAPPSFDDDDNLGLELLDFDSS